MLVVCGPHQIWMRNKMPALHGVRTFHLIINDTDAVHIYSDPEWLKLQLRRDVATANSIDASSFKVAVTLTPKQAMAIAGELLTQAARHYPSETTESTAAPVSDPVYPTPKPTNRGRPWTQEEVDWLVEAHAAGWTMPQIAEALQRGIGGIQEKLIKLGRMTREQYQVFPEGVDASVKAGTVRPGPPC